MLDIRSLLSELQIEAEPIEGPRLTCGPVYMLRPSSEAERDGWMARLSSRPGVVALTSDEPHEWLLNGEPSPQQVRAMLDDAARMLRELDGSTESTPAAPDRIRAIGEWSRAHPDGAPLSSLLDAIANAPLVEVASTKREVPTGDGASPPARCGETVAVVLTDEDPTAILASIGFGYFNACPPAAYHIACLRRWARDYGATLIGLEADSYVVDVDEPPADEKERRRLLDEIELLGPDEHPPLGELGSVRRWRFWWD